VYKHSEDGELVGYSDASFTNGVNGAHSEYGWLYICQGAIICAKASTLGRVYVSSFGTEYASLSECVKQGVYLRALFTEMAEKTKSQHFEWNPVQGPTQLYQDNKSVVYVTRNDSMKRKTRHVLVRHLHVKEAISNGEFKVDHVTTDNQKADFLTKPLDGIKFTRAIDAVMQR